jgi:predicted enzyme related to lactoylglutathione lyase
MPNSTGLTHLAFEVEDVEQTLNMAIKNGGQPLGEISQKTIDAMGEIKFIYIRDPEGNIIEIQSWPK